MGWPYSIYHYRLGEGFQVRLAIFWPKFAARFWPNLGARGVFVGGITCKSLGIGKKAMYIGSLAFLLIFGWSCDCPWLVVLLSCPWQCQIFVASLRGNIMRSRGSASPWSKCGFLVLHSFMVLAYWHLSLSLRNKKEEENMEVFAHGITLHLNNTNTK